MSDEETYLVEGVVMSKTAKAVMVGEEKDGAGEWFPFSAVVESDPEDLRDAERGDEVTFSIPLWLAKKKGLS